MSNHNTILPGIHESFHTQSKAEDLNISKQTIYTQHANITHKEQLPHKIIIQAYKIVTLVTLIDLDLSDT
jgi:hypothetical protein